MLFPKRSKSKTKNKTGLDNSGFNTVEAAEYIGVSAQWLRMSRMKNPSWPGPRYVKVGGRTVIYLRRHLDEFIAHRVLDPADRLRRLHDAKTFTTPG